MVDYSEIKEKCPKAFLKLSAEYPYINCEFFGAIFNDRDLYEFFDKNKIHIEMSYECTRKYGGDVFQAYLRYFPSDGDIFEVLHVGAGHKTRREAETAAFKRAFNILEEKL